MKRKISNFLFMILILLIFTGCSSNVEHQNNFSGTGTIYRYGTENLYEGDSIKNIEYVMDSSSFEHSTYLKHEVDNFIIKKTYVCFVTDKEYCMENNADAEDENIEILKANDSWFSEHNGRCIYGTGIIRTYCFGGGFSNLEISDSAIIADLSNGEYCSANNVSNSSSCN